MSKLHAFVLIENETFEKLEDAAKKLDSIHRERSQRKEEGSNSEKKEDSLNEKKEDGEVRSHPMQKGFGDADAIGLEEENRFRTPAPAFVPLSDASDERSPDYKKEQLVTRFVKHIKKRNQAKAKHVLTSLLAVPEMVSWDNTGDFKIRGKYIGQLHHLLPRLFYGSRRIPVIGEHEFFDIIKELGLGTKATNKSKPIKYKRTKKNVEKSSRPTETDSQSKWYELRM